MWMETSTVLLNCAATRIPKYIAFNILNRNWFISERQLCYLPKSSCGNRWYIKNRIGKYNYSGSHNVGTWMATSCCIIANPLSLYTKLTFSALVRIVNTMICSHDTTKCLRHSVLEEIDSQRKMLHCFL